MKEQDALNILVQAVHIGQTKGAYNLQEAKLIAEAVEVFVKKPEQTNKVEEVNNIKEEKTDEEKSNG